MTFNISDPNTQALLMFLAIGLVAGWLAGMLLGGGGLIRNLIVGVLGRLRRRLRRQDLQHQYRLGRAAPQPDRRGDDRRHRRRHCRKAVAMRGVLRLGPMARDAEAQCERRQPFGWRQYGRFPGGPRRRRDRDRGDGFGPPGEPFLDGRKFQDVMRADQRVLGAPNDEELRWLRSSQAAIVSASGSDISPKWLRCPTSSRCRRVHMKTF